MVKLLRPRHSAPHVVHQLEADPLFLWTGVLKALSQLVPDVPQHLKLMDKLLSMRHSAPHVIHPLEADPYSSGLVRSRPSASWYQMSLSTSNSIYSTL